MNVRNAGGNRQNASSGRINNSAANSSRGMTNGLGGRTNGMTNGLGGRTNGMTNGLGGRTNGLTNGLGGRTNGLTNGLGGMTNGLTNGLGSGGPVMRSRRMDDAAISPFRISLIIVIAFIIMVPASFMLLSYNEAAYSGIRVDGDFLDWDEVTVFTDAEQYSVANLDIVDYAAGTNDAGGLFFYASARGNWFSGSGADSLMVFIDSDGNPDTGYSVRGMGAEYLIDIYGWNSQIQGRQLGIFSGQDNLNWSAWNWRGVSAAVSLTEIEVGIQSSTVELQPTHSFLFLSKSGASVADICDAAIGLNGGVLTVRQIQGAQAGIVDSDQLMTLELRALGSAVNVSAIDFAYSGIAGPTVSGLPVTVQPGTPVTLTVTSPVAGLLNGTFIDLSVSTVTSTGVASVMGEGISAYAHAAPGTIRIDGAFADWNGVSKTADTGIAANPNIDISRHASVNNSLEAFFYLGMGTDGQMFGGSYVPQSRTVPGTPGEPGEPTTPVPLPRVSGEDITRIYIDTIPGGQIAHGILADYLIEIKGREGQITSRRMYSLPGMAFVMNVDAANSGGELEVGVELGDIGYNGTLAYVMESTDWQGGNDRTAPASTIPLTRGGTRGGGSFGGGDGTIGNPYIIQDALDLQAMQTHLAAYYVLEGNIDASETSTWNSGAGFAPVGAFSGNLDGRGFTISGLYISRGATDYIGLFSQIQAAGVVQNVGLIDNNIIGRLFIGGLVGNNYGTVTNSYVTGLVSGNTGSNYVGGLVGYNYGTGKVSICYATADISGDYYIGGLMGGNVGEVTNSYARGAVTGYRYVGGLMGTNSGTVTNCYSTGLVTGTFDFGGLVGTNTGTVTNSFWDTETSGQSTSAGGTGLTTAEMMTEATFINAGWDFAGETVNGEEDIWTIDEGTSYPYFEVMAPEFHFFLLPILAMIGIVSAARIKKKKEDTESEEITEDEEEPSESTETPKINRKLLMIGLLLLCAGFIGIVGLRLGFIQNLLGDPDPYPGIGHVEPSGHIVSSIPFVIGLVTVVFWGIKNDPIYYEAEKGKKEEEAIEEEPDEEPEDMELTEPAMSEEPTERAAEIETGESEPAAEEKAPEPAEPKGQTLDHIPEDLREELLDSITEIEHELSKIQSTAASKPKPQILKGPKPAPLEDPQAEKKRVERCHKMLSFANMAENDKEQLRALIDTGISVHDFTENVKEAVERQKKKKAAEAKAADQKTALREDDLVAELTSLGDELGDDVDEADLEDIILSADRQKKKEK